MSVTQHPFLVFGFMLLVGMIVPGGTMSVARDLRHLLDPVAFCVERLGFTPDNWQRDLLLSIALRIIVLASRQAGKSKIAAGLATHEAYFHARSLVLIFGPSARQSNTTFQQIQDFASMLGPGVIVEQTKTSLRFANDSRVVSLPASPDTIRGFSGVSTLVVDEASRVDDSLYVAIRPMLAASNGRLILASTPAGRRGFFSDAWHGEPGWERIRVTADQCPRISPAFLAEERRTMGPRWFGQEYECSFEAGVDSLFSFDVVQAALDPDVVPLFDDDGSIHSVASPLSPNIQPMPPGTISP